MTWWIILGFIALVVLAVLGAAWLLVSADRLSDDDGGWDDESDILAEFQERRRRETSDGA